MKHSLSNFFIPVLTLAGLGLAACEAELDEPSQRAEQRETLPLVAVPQTPEAPEPNEATPLSGSELPLMEPTPAPQNPGNPKVCCEVPPLDPMWMTTAACLQYPGHVVVPEQECDECEALVGLCPGISYPECPPAGGSAINGDMDCDGVIDVRYFCPPGTSPADLDGDGCEEICACDPCEDFYGLCQNLDYSGNCPYPGAPDAINGDLDCDGSPDVRYVCPPGTWPGDPNGDGCNEACLCDNDPLLSVCCDHLNGMPPSTVPAASCMGNLLPLEACFGQEGGDD
ncbi:hypothetical protein ENSA5_04870 [Enhygromyxa salina]|uniref:Uncharacterized protein n=1 Tax=Enhygromyxa salina TaxID=215803 RepID=A0A2S9YI53_9BACT|nr:hypothetical protein [Enhygromyxa salina]PRQ04722.1 hypothetical protein ENSA5_04870 [Enhygromyxa salina]